MNNVRHCPFKRLPTFGSGGYSEANRLLRVEAFKQEFYAFTAWMESVVKDLGFAPGTRTWCYLFEQAELITKGQFPKATNWLSKYRKCNWEENPYGLYIPRRLICDDLSRSMEGYDFIDSASSPKAYAMELAERMLNGFDSYCPDGFWEYQSFAPILICEKRDIMMMCRKFLPNAVKSYATKGYGDINSRYALVDQIEEYQAIGVTPIVFLLYDHDPAGFHITDIFRKNLKEAGGALGWDGANELRIERIGLSTQQVEDYDFTKIAKLETSSGKDLADPDHEHATREYVKAYREEVGDWKCESNALITSPSACKTIMESTVLQYISARGIDGWNAANREATKEVDFYKEQMRALLHFATESGMVFNDQLMLMQKQAKDLKFLGG